VCPKWQLINSFHEKAVCVSSMFFCSLILVRRFALSQAARALRSLAMYKLYPVETSGLAGHKTPPIFPYVTPKHPGKSWCQKRLTR